MNSDATEETLSTDVVHLDLAEPFAAKWSARLGVESHRGSHHKHWQHARLSEALERSGVLRPGKSGIGFGAGTEPLAALYASLGAEIVIADRAPSRDTEVGVERRRHDVNSFEPELVDRFDFSWSEGAAEELGSTALEQHLAWSAHSLRDGGVTALTTEMVISTPPGTVDPASTSVGWSLDDLLRVFEGMLDLGLVADRFHIRLREDERDDAILFEPSSRDIEGSSGDRDTYPMKTANGPYATTTVLLVFRKRELTAAERESRRAFYRADHEVNLRALAEHLASDGDIADYAAAYDGTETIDVLTAPVKLTVAPGEERTVEFVLRNTSDRRFFLPHPSAPLGVPQVSIVATGNDGASRLRAVGWQHAALPDAEVDVLNGDAVRGWHRILPGDAFICRFSVRAPASGEAQETFDLLLSDGRLVPGSTMRVTVSAEAGPRAAVSPRRRELPAGLGVNVVGFVAGEDGLGVAARSTVTTLRDAGVPVSIVNVQTSSAATSHEWHELSHLAVDGSSPLPHPVTIVHTSPHHAARIRSSHPALFAAPVVASVPFWELPEAPLSWLPELARYDAVLAPTSFIAAGISSQVAVPVLEFPIAPSIPEIAPRRRADFGLPEDKVLFAASFSLNSGGERKNSIGLLKAFSGALAMGADAALVLKVSRSDLATPRLVRELNRLPAGSVVLIEQSMTYPEVLAMYASCDAYISLHRSEGLGLGPFEAMTAGVPVVATGWSGNMNYMDAASASLVEYSLTPVVDPIAEYSMTQFHRQQWWAQPDLLDAALRIHRLATDPAYRLALGAAGKEKVDGYAARWRETAVRQVLSLYEAALD